MLQSLHLSSPSTAALRCHQTAGTLIRRLHDSPGGSSGRLWAVISFAFFGRIWFDLKFFTDLCLKCLVLCILYVFVSPAWTWGPLSVNLQTDWAVIWLIERNRLFCPSPGGTWLDSRAHWWATSQSPFTSLASSWVAFTMPTTSPEPCTKGSQRLRTCLSHSTWTGHCSVVRNGLLFFK